MINAQQARTGSLENKDSDLDKSLLLIEKQIVSKMEKGYFACFTTIDLDSKNNIIRIARKLQELGYVVIYRIDEEYDTVSIDIKW